MSNRYLNGRAHLTDLEEHDHDGSFKRVGILSSSGRQAEIDDVTNGLIMVSQEHHEIHEGDHFFHNDTHELSTNGVLDYQIITPNTTRWGHFLLAFTAEAETEFYLYEGITVNTPGTQNGYNSNRNLTNTPTVEVREIENTNVSNANADTDVSSATVLWHGKVGSGKKDGGSTQRSNEIILKQNTSYSLRFISVSPGYLDIDFQWYEHISKTS